MAQSGYVTFIVHCPHCHQQLSPAASEGPTTAYHHENASECPEGGDIELPTVTVEQLVSAFGAKTASQKKAKK